MEHSQVTAPTVRSTYGLMVTVGALVLTLGLLLPFVVAEKASVGGQAGLSALPSAAPQAGELLDSPDGLSGGTGVSGPSGPGGATGPGGAVAGPGGGTAVGSGSNAALRTASDVGITRDFIKLGILVIDTSQYASTGDDESSFGAGIGDVRLQWQVYIDEVNARGGINGRKIQPVFKVFDGFDRDSLRAACIYLTEEAKVFAVVNAGGFYGDPILCVTEQHKTFFYGQAGEALDFYARSKGLYFTTTPNKDRTLLNLVAELDRDGALKGKRLGLLSAEGIDSIPVDRSLKPALQRAGYTVTYEARISSDSSAAQSQIPLEVQQMISKEVQVILPLTGLIIANVFVQQADSQRYYPQYYTSDFASGGTDIYTVGMPESFQGSVTYTSLRTGEARAGMPEYTADANCRKRYEAAAKKALDRQGAEYYSTVTACGIMDSLVRAMGGAGINLTRASLSQAMRNLGRFDVPFSSIGSFGAGKYDAPDALRKAVWKADCRCWVPTTAFKRTVY